MGLPGGSDGKESTCQCKRDGLDPWVRKIPWRRIWQSAPIFLPGEPHGRRSLVGYSPRGHKECDPTYRVNRQLSACGCLGDSEPSGLGTDSSRGCARNYCAQHLHQETLLANWSFKSSLQIKLETCSLQIRLTP